METSRRFGMMSLVAALGALIVPPSWLLISSALFDATYRSTVGKGNFNNPSGEAKFQAIRWMFSPGIGVGTAVILTVIGVVFAVAGMRSATHRAALPAIGLAANILVVVVVAYFTWAMMNAG